LLNKLVKIRATGKKEDSDNNSQQTTNSVDTSPVSVNVNTQEPSEEEAVG
jgi:hypothetical protein